MTLPILWHSNSPLATTGYGQQTALWTYRLVDHRRTAISAYYGLEGSPILWSDKEIPVLPGLGGDFGNEYLTGHADSWFGDLRAGLVLTLMDILVLNPKTLAEMNVACYMPVDHQPLTPAQREILTMSGAIPIAMSEFGREQLDHFGFEPLYVPHGVDAETYKPQEKAEARRKVGADPDIFICGIVAANKGLPSRKALHQSLQAFARLHKAHPGEVMLYLHTEMTGRFSRGVPIVDVMDSLGLDRNCIATCDQYRLLFHPFPTAEMASIMSTFDCLLNPSMGGGFECAILEAAAVGCPTITTNFSAMPQVAGPSPWKVGGEWEWTGQGSWQIRPSVDEIYECLEEAFEMKGTPAAEELSYDLRKHALDYEIDKVMNEHMLPTIEEIEERIGVPPAKQNGHLSVGDLKLKIEDHPTGGVAETVAREIEQAYRLDEIPFKEGDVVVDIGAHVGVVSIYLAKAHPEITVHAFEPLPENYERLVRNIEANEVPNVIPHPWAITEDGRPVDLVTHAASNSGGASEFVVGPDAGEKVSVSSLAFNEMLDDYEINRVRLLKIDCEGAEYEILGNGAPLDRIDHIRGEFHTNAELERLGNDPEALTARLKEALGEKRVLVHTIGIAE